MKGGYSCNMSKKEGYSYLNGNKWVDITREERFFCLVAYNYFNDNPYEAVNWINQKCELGLDSAIIDKQNWEIGFEVALYRDYIHLEEKGFSDEEDRFRKRTFDLCFFSEAYLIIIEAKAYSRFDSEQLKVFKKDKNDIPDRILNRCISNTEVKFVALISHHYSPSKESIDGIFNCKITANRSIEHFPAPPHGSTGNQPTPAWWGNVCQPVQDVP